MDSKKLLVITALAIGGVSGCAVPQLPSQQAEQLTVAKAQREIKIGMTSEQVVEALGSPNMVTTDSQRRETWVYDKVSTNVQYSKNTTQVGTQVDTQDTTQVIIKIGLTIEKIFVFVTRDGLNMLPYSVNEIYYLKNSGYYQNTRQVYNSMHQVYPEKKWKI